jgi:hypothetical protein
MAEAATKKSKDDKKKESKTSKSPDPTEEKPTSTV